jgi:heme exporter protein D
MNPETIVVLRWSAVLISVLVIVVALCFAYLRGRRNERKERERRETEKHVDKMRAEMLERRYPRDVWHV